MQRLEITKCDNIILIVHDDIVFKEKFSKMVSIRTLSTQNCVFSGVGYDEVIAENAVNSVVKGFSLDCNTTISTIKCT